MDFYTDPTEIILVFKFITSSLNSFYSLPWTSSDEITPSLPTKMMTIKPKNTRIRMYIHLRRDLDVMVVFLLPRSIILSNTVLPCMRSPKKHNEMDLIIRRFQGDTFRKERKRGWLQRHQIREAVIVHLRLLRFLLPWSSLHLLVRSLIIFRGLSFGSSAKI